MVIGFRRLAASWIALTACLLPTGEERAYAAGGAFAVDDVEIGKPGDCKVESWISFAGNSDFNAVTSPACVVNLGLPVELGAHLHRFRSDGVWGTSGALAAKVNLIPVDGHPFGLGIAGNSHWNLITGANTGGAIYVPVTFQLRNDLRLNVNGGWLYDNVARLHYLTWGAGLEWNFVKPLTLIGEVFGQAGKLPGVGEDEPPSPNAIRQPRAQVGLRFTPQDKFDIDVIWGHNIGGENAHWLTLGLNLRF